MSHVRSDTRCCRARATQLCASSLAARFLRQTWLLSLESENITAVTADEQRAEAVTIVLSPFGPRRMPANVARGLG